MDREEQGKGEEEESSEGEQEKNNAKYPDSRTPMFYSPCRTPPPSPPPFFLYSRPFIRRPQYRQQRHPLARGGPSRLFHCATFAQGLLEIRASDFSPFFFNAFPSLSLSLSFSPFFFPAPPLPFPVVPAIVRSNEESRRDIGRGNVRMTQQMRWNEITSVPGFIVSPAGAQELCFFLAKLL